MIEKPGFFEKPGFWRLRYQFGYPMGQVERIHEHPFLEDHVLYVLATETFANVLLELIVPSKHFVTLLVADFSRISLEDLVSFSQEMIRAGSRSFVAWGNQCRIAHHAFDLACVDFEPESKDVILTDDLSRGSLEDAIWNTLNLAEPMGSYANECYATIAVCVDELQHGRTIREAFSDPVTFSDENGPHV